MYVFPREVTNFNPCKQMSKYLHNTMNLQRQKNLTKTFSSQKFYWNKQHNLFAITVDAKKPLPISFCVCKQATYFVEKQ